MKPTSLLSVLVVALACVAAAAPAAPAKTRIDTLAEQLRERPLAISDDLVFLFDERQRAALKRRLRASGTPVYVAVLATLEQDESGGDQARQLESIYQRLGRPGVYMVLDEDGYIEVGHAETPFEFELSFGDLIPDDERGTPARWPDRIGRILDKVQSGTPAAPKPFHSSREPKPLPDLSRSIDPEPMPVATAVRNGLLIGVGLVVLTIGVVFVVRRIIKS